MSKQELKLIAVAKDFDKAAGDIRKVSDAERQLADDVLKSGTASTQAAEAARTVVAAHTEQAVASEGARSGSDSLAAAQFKLEGAARKAAEAQQKQAEATKGTKASTSDLTGLLSQINPQLGILVDSLFKSGNIAGALAAQNITLGGTFQKVTAAIKNNAAALKLIGAGGAVVLAIFAIVKAFQKMKEESDRVTASLKRQRDALNELRGAQRDQQQAIENISDKRRIGGLSPEAAIQAQGVAASIAQRFPQLSPESINQAVGNLGGLGLSPDQLTQASILQQIGQLDVDPRSSVEGLKASFERSLKRNLDAVGKFLERETAQRAGVATAAVRQSRSTGSETIAIEDFIRQLPGKLGFRFDPAQLAKVVQGLAETKGEEGLSPLSASGIARTLARDLGDTIVALFSSSTTDNQSLIKLEAKARILQERADVTGEGGGPVSANLIRTAELVLQQLERAAEKLEAAAEKQSNGAAVHNDFRGANITARDAQSQRRLVLNGQSLRDLREEG